MTLDMVVGVSMVGMSIWTLIPDKPERVEPAARYGVFITTLIAFFVAEIGDKTQLATIALAAGYRNLLAVVLGTTSGMLLANVPVVFLGSAFAHHLPMKAIRYSAAALFAIIGAVFIARSTGHNIF